MEIPKWLQLRSREVDPRVPVRKMVVVGPEDSIKELIENSIINDKLLRDPSWSNEKNSVLIEFKKQTIVKYLDESARKLDL